jgi:FixJ family two-component response regulator
MPALPPIVAIVDDEPSLRTALGRLLRSHGYTVASFESGEAFLVVPGSSYACILLDLNMARTGGLDVLKALVNRVKGPPVVVLTGHDEPGVAEKAAQFGAYAYLTKPVEEVPLLQAIENAIKSKPRVA